MKLENNGPLHSTQYFHTSDQNLKMEVDQPKRFQVKKWNAVALWAWGSSS
jgi:hypothetical protein